MGIIHKEIDVLTGTVTNVHDVGDKISIEKKYDAQPFLDHAHDMRVATDGERWGDHRHIGVIPMAELSKMMRHDGFSKKELEAWLQKNPKFVTFNKFLRTGAKG